MNISIEFAIVLIVIFYLMCGYFYCVYHGWLHTWNKKNWRIFYWIYYIFKNQKTC